jgi:HSP20 family protein
MAKELLGTTARPAAMPIDAFRRGDEFVVQMDMPGVRPDDFELTVERNVLTVHARRQRATAEDDELLIAERPYGEFSRQLFLGDTLDADRLMAQYDDGVLTLRLPVREQAKPRRVEVTSGTGTGAAIETTAAEDRSEPVSTNGG